MATQTRGAKGKEMVPWSFQKKTISQFRFPPVMNRNTVALRKASLLLSVPICLGHYAGLSDHLFAACIYSRGI